MTADNSSDNSSDKDGQSSPFNRTAQHLIFDDQAGQPDLALVFLKGLDGVQHKFWQFMDQKHFPDIDLE